MVLALRGELYGLVAAGFGVFEDFAFVITDHDFLVLVIEDVTGIDRNFAVADAANRTMMKIPEREILKTTCAMTVIGGEIVYEAR